MTVIGDAGSKIDLFMCYDNGNGYPGALFADFGQIAGDSVGANEVASSLVVPAGVMWLGGTVQVVTTTQPTVEIINQGLFQIAGASQFLANLQVGWSMTGVTAGAPNPFTPTPANAGSVPRVYLKAA